MHIVIMGCGRVGSTLAHILEDRGYTVAVIDQDPEAFRRLRPSFKGDRVTGVGFDRDVLARAGIERADGFAAVSSGDNSNIIAARVARETFARPPGGGADLRPAAGRGVRAARHPDRRHRPLDGRPDAAQAAAGRRHGAALAGRHRQAGADPGDDVAQVDRRADQAGRGVGRRARIAYIDRLGEAVVPQIGTVLQEGDVVHVIARESDLDRVMAARLPRVTGVSTDAGRHRRRGRRGQVHRPRAA